MPRGGRRAAGATKVVECILCSAPLPEPKFALDSPCQSCDSVRDFLVKHDVVSLAMSTSSAVDLCDPCGLFLQSCDDLVMQLRKRLDFCKDLRSARVTLGDWEEYQADYMPSTGLQSLALSHTSSRRTRLRRKIVRSPETQEVSSKLRKVAAEIFEEPPTPVENAEKIEVIPETHVGSPSLKLESVKGENGSLSDEEQQQQQRNMSDADFFDVGNESSDDDSDKDSDADFFGEDEKKKPTAKSNAKTTTRVNPVDWTKDDPACGEPRPFEVLKKQGVVKYVVDGFIFGVVRASRSDPMIVFVRCNHHRVAGVECQVNGAVNLREKNFYYDPVTLAVNHNHLEAAVSDKQKMLPPTSTPSRNGPKPERQPQFLRRIMATGRRGFACELCDFTTRVQLFLVSHYHTSHRECEGERCFECGRCFDNHDEYQEHMDRHLVDAREKVVCLSCRAPMKKVSFPLHVRGYHKGKILWTAAHREAAGLKMIRCALCPYQVEGKNPFHLHAVQAHYGEKAYACEMCTDTFTSERNLRDHMNVVHVFGDHFHCKSCGLEFDTRIKLQKHRLLHMPLKGKKLCPECGVAFAFHAYRDHMVLVHNQPTSHKCKECGEEVATYNRLRSHMTKAHGVIFPPPKRKFKICEDCGKSFRSITLYQTHRVQHHGEDPPPSRGNTNCSFCGRECKTKMLLRQHHINAHGWYFIEQVKDGISCKMCQAVIREKYGFQTHLKTAHNLSVQIKKIKAYMQIPDGGKNKFPVTMNSFKNEVEEAETFDLPNQPTFIFV